VNIAFDLDWPMIVKDLARYLLGQDLLKGTRISEADELPLNSLQEMCKESDINFYRHNMKPIHYSYVLNSFRTFEGKSTKACSENAIGHFRDET